MHNSTKCLVLVDDSNVFISAKQASAVRHGLGKVPDEPAQDPQYRLDFARLLVHLSGEKKIISAVLVGSRPPENDALWALPRVAASPFSPPLADITTKKRLSTPSWLPVGLL
jgi:hypothetical protein